MEWFDFSENSELHFGNFRTILNTSKEKPEYPVEGGDRNEHWKEGTAMNICRVGQNGNMLVSSRFFFSCMARFFAGLFFDVFFGFFFMQSRRLEQLQPA